MKGIWLNTTTIPENILDIIRNSEDCIFVAPNTVDIRVFLDNIDAVRELVDAGKLVFHAWSLRGRSSGRRIFSAVPFT
jgi:hypothetical protein